MSLCPLSAATINAVFPSCPLTLTSALASSSALTVSLCPSSADHINAVCSSLFLALTSALASSSALTMSLCPSLADHINAVFVSLLPSIWTPGNCRTAWTNVTSVPMLTANSSMFWWKGSLRKTPRRLQTSCLYPSGSFSSTAQKYSWKLKCTDWYWLEESVIVEPCCNVLTRGMSLPLDCCLFRASTSSSDPAKAEDTSVPVNILRCCNWLNTDSLLRAVVSDSSSTYSCLAAFCCMTSLIARPYRSHLLSGRSSTENILFSSSLHPSNMRTKSDNSTGVRRK